MNLVSAIITTHNRCKDLIKAIESVKLQTYQNIEIIVVDDASDDDTESVCNSIDGIKYIRIDKSESNGGNHARNVGIIESRGEYVAFLDDDDYWVSTKIEKQISAFLDVSIGMVYCGIHVYTGKKHLDYDVTYEVEGNVLERKQYWKPFCVTSTAIFRRSVFQSVGMFDENLRYWQEYELCLRVIQKYDVALVKESLVIYKKVPSDKNKLTNNIDGWLRAVSYVKNKHEQLIKTLGDNTLKFEENFLAEAAYRYSNVNNITKMKEYYMKAYKLTGKKTYYLRAKFSITRQKTAFIEAIVRRFISIQKRK